MKNTINSPKTLGTLFQEFITNNTTDAYYMDSNNEYPRLKIQRIVMPQYKNYFLIDFAYEVNQYLEDSEIFIAYTNPKDKKSYWYAKQSCIFPMNTLSKPFDSIISCLEDLEYNLCIEFEDFLWNNYYELFQT